MSGILQTLLTECGTFSTLHQRFICIHLHYPYLTSSWRGLFHNAQYLGSLPKHLMVVWCSPLQDNTGGSVPPSCKQLRNDFQPVVTLGTRMSSGVVRHGQLQTGTYHWKFRRNFQVGEDKPLLIHIVGKRFFSSYLSNIVLLLELLIIL